MYIYIYQIKKVARDLPAAETSLANWGQQGRKGVGIYGILGQSDANSKRWGGHMPYLGVATCLIRIGIKKV